MRKTACLAAAAAFLLSGAAIASAQTMSNTARPTDTLSLSSMQQKTVWKDLSSGATNQIAPSGFSSNVGSAVPSAVNVKPVTAKAARDVPALKPYDFAMVQHKLLIVNPSDHKIADVISG